MNEMYFYILSLLTKIFFSCLISYPSEPFTNLSSYFLFQAEI